MHELSPLPNPSQLRLRNAISSLQQGLGVLVTDDLDRENEGDMVFAAQSLTEPQMALLIREGSGIVCLCMEPEHADALDLPPMVPNNTSRFGTAFTVSIEAAEGVSTGVSAADRVHTVRTAISDTARPSDLARPGHVFPLRARSGGVLERAGHTEAVVDLMKLAGLKPCGVLCELTNPDGSMARLPQVLDFGKTHQMPVLSVGDIIQCRQSSKSEGAATIF